MSGNVEVFIFPGIPDTLIREELQNMSHKIDLFYPDPWQIENLQISAFLKAQREQISHHFTPNSVFAMRPLLALIT